MITQVTFVEKYRCFDQGDSLKFLPGVNLLVGDQGCGKSSLLLAFRNHRDGLAKPIIRLETDKPTTTLSCDFEKDNPRLAERSQTDGLAGNRLSFRARLAVAFASHGQVVNKLCAVLDQKEPATFLMDEPDMALSIRSIRHLVDRLRRAEETGHQIIAAVHNPLLIQRFQQVLSLEHRRWMPSQEFIDLHLSA